MVILMFFFFKQKTAYEMRISDWSSDVCSSDLDAADQPARQGLIVRHPAGVAAAARDAADGRPGAEPPAAAHAVRAGNLLDLRPARRLPLSPAPGGGAGRRPAALVGGDRKSAV